MPKVRIYVKPPSYDRPLEQSIDTLPTLHFTYTADILIFRVDNHQEQELAVLPQKPIQPYQQWAPAECNVSLKPETSSKNFDPFNQNSGRKDQR